MRYRENWAEQEAREAQDYSHYRKLCLQGRVHDSISDERVVKHRSQGKFSWRWIIYYTRCRHLVHCLGTSSWYANGMMRDLELHTIRHYTVDRWLHWQAHKYWTSQTRRKERRRAVAHA